MKNLFRRGSRAGAPRKTDAFMERETYWDEEDQAYDWDSAEAEEYEAAGMTADSREFREDGTDTGYEPVETDFSEDFQEDMAEDFAFGDAAEEMDIDLDSYELEEPEEQNADTFSREFGEDVDADMPRNSRAERRTDDYDFVGYERENSGIAPGYQEEAAFYGDAGEEEEYPEAAAGEGDYWEEGYEEEVSSVTTGRNTCYESDAEADFGYEEQEDSYYEAEEESDSFCQDQPVQDFRERHRPEREMWDRRTRPETGGPNRKTAEGQKKGFFARMGSAVRSMDVMDRVMIIAGVAVLVMAIVTGAVFVNMNISKKQIDSFADVGRQLEGITMIGGLNLSIRNRINWWQTCLLPSRLRTRMESRRSGPTTIWMVSFIRKTLRPVPGRWRWNL